MLRQRLLYKIFAFVFGISSIFFLSRRLFFLGVYNWGDIQLVHALFASRDDQMIDRLSRARESFLAARQSSFALHAPVWSLSYIELLTHDYDLAATWMDEGLALERDSFVLTADSADYHILQGILASRRSDWSAALQSYRLALALEPKVWDIDIYQRYYTTLVHQGGEAKSLAALIVNYLNDNRLLAQSEAVLPRGITQPLPLLTAETSMDCWAVTAVQYHPEAVALGPLVPVQLSWQNRETGQQRQTAFLAVNLAPNAGFEWGTVAGQPIGYPNTIYVEDKSKETHHVLQTAVFSNTLTTVASLENSAIVYNSSYVSEPIEVDSDKMYLLGTWLKNEQAQGGIGFGWYGRLDNINPYQFVNSPTTGQSWGFYGQMVTIPVAVQTIDLVLLNYHSEGTTYYDDILFFQIIPPSCD